ncbi:GT-D fold domain-containing glycosyltransferase [Actinomyces procaprae]|uniref:GT-D fold domain-containing glycosyltransferase n=1 Tax=Actinomyces procaprae TaxID=2560010 RepID=UPI00109E1BBB|nr:GT-D fold domain-containing glycosyltransferase [Actinomyces procaprae]
MSDEFSDSFRLAEALRMLADVGLQQTEAVQRISGTVSDLAVAVSRIQRDVAEVDRMLEVLGRATLLDILADVDATIQARQLSMLETLDRVSEGYSLARWGDGEVRLMLQPEFQLMFQQPDACLAAELRGILEANDTTSGYLLLGMPTVFTTRLWMGIYAESWHELAPILKSSVAPWGNTHVSRPLAFQRCGERAVEGWRRVWNRKSVCIIAGRGSKFELIPQLFDNALSVDRIDAPPRDAFAEIDAVKADVLSAPSADVYLLALGPTATVLASWLSSEDGGSRHAVDIGHLSASYANVFLGGRFPESLPLVGNVN